MTQALAIPPALRAGASVAAALSLIPVAEGKATRYNPGVMDRVVTKRIWWKHIDVTKPHAGYIALADKQYIGELAWIQWPSGELTGPYLVADCGRATDQEHLKKIGFAVDLSWELAVQFNVIDRPLPGVKVFIQRNAEQKDVL